MCDLYQELSGLPSDALPFEIKRRGLNEADVTHLLSVSARAWATNAHESLRAAFLANQIAESLGTGTHRLLNARCWSTLGNARRLLHDLDGAEVAFRRAESFLRPDDPAHQVAEHLEMRVAYHETRRDYKTALEMLDLAVDLRASAGDLLSLSRAKLLYGVVHEHTGEPERAIPHLIDAWEYLAVVARSAGDSAELRQVMVAAGQALVLRLLDAELPDRALAVYRQCERLFHEAEDALHRLKLKWMLSRILRAVGEMQAALAVAHDVRKEFVVLGMPYEAALATVDALRTAELLGSPAVTRQLVNDLLPLLGSLGVGEGSAAYAMAARINRGKRCADRLEGFLQRLPLGR